MEFEFFTEKTRVAGKKTLTIAPDGKIGFSTEASKELPFVKNEYVSLGINKESGMMCIKKTSPDTQGSRRVCKRGSAVEVTAGVVFRVWNIQFEQTVRISEYIIDADSIAFDYTKGEVVNYIFKSKSKTPPVPVKEKKELDPRIEKIRKRGRPPKNPTYPPVEDDDEIEVDPNDYDEY